MDLTTVFTLPAFVRSFVYDETRDLFYVVTVDGETENGQLHIWSPFTQTLSPSVMLPGHAGVGMTISSDGEFLLVAQQDVTVITDEGPWWEHLFEGTIHRIDLDTFAMEDLHFIASGSERGSWDVAIAGETAVFTTSFNGSGWTPFRQFEAAGDPSEFTLVSGLSEVVAGAFLYPSESGRYVLVNSRSITSFPLYLYDSASGAVVASTDTFELGVYANRIGLPDISESAGLVVYGMLVLDLDLNLVQDLGDIGAAAQFSDTGDHFFVWSYSEDAVLVYDTTPTS